MRFLSLELINFGGHEKLVCPDLNVPIVGISGTNGKGKTTTMRALRYILTGDLPEDNAQSYMRNGGVGGTTVAKSRILAQGAQGTMTRKITKSGQSRELVWGEGPPITKDAEVQTKLRSILGADLTTIGNAVFVPQGKLDELLFSTEATREQQFLRMIGCAHFENVARTAAKEASQLLSSAPDVEGTLAECRTQMRDYTSRWDELKAAVGDCPDVSAPLAWMRAYVVLLSKLETAQLHLETSKQTLRALIVAPGGVANSSVADMALQQKIEEIAALQAEMDRYVRVDDQLRTEIGERANYDLSKGQRDGSNAAVQAFGEYVDTTGELGAELGRVQTRGAEARSRKDAAVAQHAAAKSLAEATANRNHIEAEVAKLESNEPAKTTQEEADELGALRSQLKLAAALAQHVHVPGTEVKCPLCASTLDPSWANAEHTRQLENMLRKLQADFDAKAAAWSKWHTDVVRLKRDLSAAVDLCTKLSTACGVHDITALAAEETAAEKELEAMIQLYRTTQEKLNAEMPKAKAFNNAVARRDQARADFERIWGARVTQMEAVDISETRSRLAANTAALEETRTKQKAANARKDQLLTLAQQLKNAERNQEQAAQRVTEAELALQKHNAEKDYAIAAPNGESNAEVIAALERKQAERTRAVGAAEEMQKTINDLTTRIVELQAQRDKSAKARYTAERLTLLAAAFQRDGISRHYTAAVYAKLLRLVSQHLENLDANFVIRRAEGVLTFEFMRTDEDGAIWLPQHKLSGGQRVRMAVAFLLAVQQLILPEVGLLVLDEPTDGLDPAGRADLRDTLERAAEILDSNDAQMIICDHSGTLDPVYRATIAL